MFELMSHLKFDFEIDFLGISSYMGNIKPKYEKPQLNLETSINLKNKNVILVDDIVESGRTINVAIEYLKKQKCASIQTVVFAKKDNKHYQWKKSVEFFTFKVENKFLIGYGFDLNDKYRDLDFVCYIEFDSLCMRFLSMFSALKKNVCNFFSF